MKKMLWVLTLLPLVCAVRPASQGRSTHLASSDSKLLRLAPRTGIEPV